MKFTFQYGEIKSFNEDHLQDFTPVIYIPVWRD